MWLFHMRPSETNQPDNCHCFEPCFLYRDVDDHNLNKHAMTHAGGFVRCEDGHEKEIPPDQMMRVRWRNVPSA